MLRMVSRYRLRALVMAAVWCVSILGLPLSAVSARVTALTSLDAAAQATAPARRLSTLLVVDGDSGVIVDLNLMVTAAGVCHFHTASDRSPLPDPSCTPGVISARVTQDDLSTTICASGYTATVRPSSSATNKVKALNYIAYAETPDPRDENDHLVPLELGGANDPRNLWNEPPMTGQLSTTNPKDTVENKLHALVCAGTMTLADAQHRIATDWTTALLGT